jgi:hypothetical protein
MCAGRDWARWRGACASGAEGEPPTEAGADERTADQLGRRERIMGASTTVV